MRKAINSLALLLAITVLLTMPVYAAENDQIMPCESEVLSRYTGYLSVSSGNEIKICFVVMGTQSLDKIGALIIEIQRSSDGESWTTVETYECADYANMMATTSYTCGSYVTHYGEYGYYYRAKVTFLGQKGNIVYTPTIYTDMIYLAP